MMQTFIFVHDQQIILDYIRVNKFSQFKNVTYVFVGKNPTNLIESLSNVIICKNLPNNLEDYPKLTSFTGWYCLWKNNLIKSDYINLFEYDINVSEDLNQKIGNEIENNKKVIGYIPLAISHHNYIKHNIWIQTLMNSLMKQYNVDLKNSIGSMNPNTIITMTSNHTFEFETFKKYMEWIDPMIDDLKFSSHSGHEIERSISVFYLLNKIDYSVLNNLIHHFQFDSHRTQTISVNKFTNQYKNLIS
jgi:hypothetical protein